MKTSTLAQIFPMRTFTKAALVAAAGALAFVGRADQLVVEHFGQAVADNSPVGTATGWTVWAVTNTILTDFSTATPNGNYPTISRAANGGVGGVTGNTVMAVVGFSTPALFWTNTPVSLHDCVVSNVVFYTKNNAASSLEQVAIQVGSQWYASTQTLHDNGGNSVWFSNYFAFTTNASAWQTLNTNDLSLGPTNTSPISGDILAIGLYGRAIGASGNKIRLDEFIVNGTPPQPPQAPAPGASPSASVTAPTTVTLSVAATGTAPLAYHWRKGGVETTDGPTGSGSTLSGSAASSLVISNTSPADSADYDVIVTNNYGITTSAVVTVTITAAGIPPSIASIVTSPTNGVSEVNSAPMGITVTAAGTGPFAYQWRKSSADISGATTSLLALPSAFTNAGSYAVVVTSAYGSVTSSPPTTLSVVDTTPPAISFLSGNPTNIVHKSTFAADYSISDNSGAAPTVVITGSVNTNVPGTYNLHFVASDAANNTNTADLVVNVLLILEHFNESPADNGAVSNAPGWHASAVAVATTTVTDYTAIGGNANFPSLSQNVTAPDAAGSTGFLVLGEAVNANPSLVWKDTTELLIGHKMTNLTFYTRNNSAATTVRVAIRVSTNWYASTATFTDNTAGAVPWAPQSYDFSDDATAWQTLDPATLTLGAQLTEPLPNFSVSAVGFFGEMVAGKIRLDEFMARGIPFTYLSTPPALGPLSYSPTNRVDGTVWSGVPLTFRVSALGTPPLSYLWRREGTVLSVTTAGSFLIDNPSPSDSGNYDVVVTNSFGGATTSSVVAVTVSAANILLAQHFAGSTNDPGIVGQIPGWHVLAFNLTNATVTDFTYNPDPPLSLNFPNLSLSLGADGGIGYLVMGQGDTVDPVLAWGETPPSLQSGHITNVLFYSRNTYPSSTIQVAALVGSQWYVSTTQFTDTTLGAVPWAAQNFVFTPDAGAWQELDTNTLVLGSTTTGPLPNQPVMAIGLYSLAQGVAAARIRVDELIVDGLAGAAAPPPPTIQPVYSDGSGNLVIRVLTAAGSTYILEGTPALQAPITWTPVTTNLGTGSTITNIVPVSPFAAGRFFRYRAQ